MKSGGAYKSTDCDTRSDRWDGACADVAGHAAAGREGSEEECDVVEGSLRA